jgi:aldehyde dehydrogenase (NAD+)
MALLPRSAPAWSPAALGFPALPGAVVDGRWLSGRAGEQIDVEDPATAATIATVVDADEDLADAAAQSAHRALVGIWAGLPPVERGRALARLASALRQEAELIATAESVDTGKPLSQARSDVEVSARYFEFYAGMADKIHGVTIPEPAGTFAYTRREPYGVSLHITPWNSPLSQMCRGIAPALAAGNAVVVKPSELTPLTSLYAALLFVRAGLPAGVCNVVPGMGTRAGAFLSRHPLVQQISFTGSVPTGRRVMAMAAERIVPCNLELGGKSPTIIMADADMETAAQAGAAAIVRNSGQSCFATTRLLVHRSRHDQLVEAVSQRIARLSVGRGLDDPDLGPLVSAAQHEKVRAYLAVAAQEGAEVIQPGGTVADGGGHFEMPAVLTGVTNQMRVAREEIFGPVQSVIPFDDEEEAIAIANDSPYGLAAGLFTASLAAAHRIAARLEAGQVQVNRYPAGGVETPFGGYKQSGLGREKGVEALHHYTQVKTVIIAL